MLLKRGQFGGGGEGFSDNLKFFIFEKKLLKLYT
jgi:hypothetical protein